MPVPPLKFYNALKRNEVDFFTGVPDSLLKQFSLCIDDHVSKEKHIIAANEGNSIALAAGPVSGLNAWCWRGMARVPDRRSWHPRQRGHLGAHCGVRALGSGWAELHPPHRP